MGRPGRCFPPPQHRRRRREIEPVAKPTPPPAGSSAELRRRAAELYDQAARLTFETRALSPRELREATRKADVLRGQAERLIIAASFREAIRR